MYSEKLEGNNYILAINCKVHNIEHNKQEFLMLIIAAGGELKQYIKINIRKINAKYFINTGKLTEIKQILSIKQIDLIVINFSLSPSQESNLETELKCRVIDRTRLILDIFALRAKTHIGKLQVELAQLNYLATRLVKGWSHLERQKGGIGLRGPGETQLETDRRLISQRIYLIKKRLDKFHKQRIENRSRSIKNAIPKIALVGYTNVGKSSLFNLLTQNNVLIKHQLFATLDPAIGVVKLPNKQKVLLSDTVGFIQDLPHQLIESFVSTLDEASYANLILHIIDISDPNHHKKIAIVNDVLRKIKADKIKQIVLYNKIDLVNDVQNDLISNDKIIAISTKKGINIDYLLNKITKILFKDKIREIILTMKQNRIRSLIYQNATVINELYKQDKIIIKFKANNQFFNKINKLIKI